jgi:Fe-S-cluster containining protein
MIHFDKATHEAIRENNTRWRGIDFVVENFEFLGASKYMPGAFIPPKNFESDTFYLYRCKLLSDDNKCTIHDDKPYVCSGYPFYGNDMLRGNSTPWPYSGCGYEKDHHLKSLHGVLVKIKQKKEELEDECNWDAEKQVL